MENCLTCNIIKVDTKYKYCINCYIAYKRYMKHRHEELKFLPDDE